LVKAVAVEAYVSGLSLECVRKLLEEMGYSMGSARLAHHLFHRNTGVNYFLDERDNRFNYWQQRRQEKEAEVFAAYLLILEEKLNALLKQDWVKESPDQFQN